MPQRPLPVPRSPEPTVFVDPYRHRAGYIRVLSELCHAEIAAMRWFESSDDPRLVDQAEIFLGARRMLIRDEAAHIADIGEIIGWLGGDGVLPMSHTTREYWRLVDVRNVTKWGWSLPLRPSVIALFMLLSEGLGYAFLYRLAHATTDPRIRAKLLSNVRDEERHTRVSIALLRRTLELDPAFWLDLPVYFLSFSVSAREAAREQYRTLGEIGLDYYDITGSCFRFVRDLFLEVFRGSRLVHPTLMPFWDRLADGMYSPLGMRAWHAAMYLPDPGISWKIRAYNGLRRRLDLGFRASRPAKSLPSKS